MKTNSLRPRIDQTVYRYFEREIHPELFSPEIIGHIKTERYEMALGFCQGGHFLKFRSEFGAVLELTVPEDQPMPETGLQRVHGFRVDDEFLFESDSPVSYHFAGEVDVVDTSIFTRVQMELELEARQAFLSHQFRRRNRLFPGPLSIAKVEGTRHSLTVHTFQTFPQDLAVLRTQALFELPG